MAHKQETAWFADEVEKKKNAATSTKNATFICEAVNENLGLTPIHGLYKRICQGRPYW